MRTSRCESRCSRSHTSSVVGGAARQVGDLDQPDLARDAAYLVDAAVERGQLLRSIALGRAEHGGGEPDVEDGVAGEGQQAVARCSSHRASLRMCPRSRWSSPVGDEIVTVRRPVRRLRRGRDRHASTTVTARPFVGSLAGARPPPGRGARWGGRIRGSIVGSRPAPPRGRAHRGRPTQWNRALRHAVQPPGQRDLRPGPRRRRVLRRGNAGRHRAGAAEQSHAHRLLGRWQVRWHQLQRVRRRGLLRHVPGDLHQCRRGPAGRLGDRQLCGGAALLRGRCAGGRLGGAARRRAAQPHRRPA